MKAVLCSVLVVFLQLATWAPDAQAQASCRFVLGFATLRDLVGAQKVGTCLEDEHFNLENGNSEQRTSGGLLVWRKIDNFTAFTDGGTTWVNGPNGLQSRANTERFSWENDPIRSVPTTAAPAALPSPTPTPQRPQVAAQSSPSTPRTSPPASAAAPGAAAPSSDPGDGDPRLLGQCVTLSLDLAQSLTPVGATHEGEVFQGLNGLCQLAVKQHGQRGYQCFESAYHHAVHLADQRPNGSPTVAVSAGNAEFLMCLSAP